METIKEIINYDKNSHLDRRIFLGRMSFIFGGVLAAFSAGLPRKLQAEIVSPDDERLVTESIEYPGETGKVRAYVARLKEDKKYPAVVIIHENRGLNSHIKDVTRRMALEGFLAMAPDALSPLGGTPEDSDVARSKLGELDYQSTVKDFVAAVEYLKTLPLSTGKVGCTGFCWGGAMTNQVAVHCKDLLAAVPYYGRQPEDADVPKIKAALLLHYAGNDERINAGIPAFEQALKKASIEYQIFMYEGASHAFNNDTSEARYDKKSAELAWKRTVAFFKEKL